MNVNGIQKLLERLNPLVMVPYTGNINRYHSITLKQKFTKSFLQIIEKCVFASLNINSRHHSSQGGSYVKRTHQFQRSTCVDTTRHGTGRGVRFIWDKGLVHQLTGLLPNKVIKVIFTKEPTLFTFSCFRAIQGDLSPGSTLVIEQTWANPRCTLNIDYHKEASKLCKKGRW